jgi:hypothetical protein
LDIILAEELISPAEPLQLPFLFGGFLVFLVMVLAKMSITPVSSQ